MKLGYPYVTMDVIPQTMRFGYIRSISGEKYNSSFYTVVITMLLFGGYSVPDLSFAEKATVRYVYGEDESTIVITDSDDVDALAAALTEDTQLGSGNCGFTQLELIF